jgi:hypothetical protein
MAPTTQEILQLKAALAAFDANKHAAYLDPDDDETNDKLLISSAIAKNTTDDEWIEFVNSGEVPPVLPVSPKLLEAVRGGMVAPPISDWEDYQNWLNSPWIF